MIQLTGTKIAIQGNPDKNISKGGIIIPDVAQERTDQGVVKYVGPKVKDIKVGDYVLFSGYDGTVVRLEGEGTLIIMREHAIVCKIGNIATDVPGLYFKGKYSKNIREEIGIILRQGATIDSIINLIAEYNSEVYFQATYEMATEFMTDVVVPINHKNPNMTRTSWREDADAIEEEEESE